MLQEILTWIVIAVCVAIAVRMAVRRLRGKGKSCGCEDGSCTPSTDTCAGCSLSDLCNNPEKKTTKK